MLLRAASCLLPLLVLTGLGAVELPDRAIIAVKPIADEDGTIAGGAGVIIDAAAGLAVTLAEVVGEDTGMVVVLPGGERREATVHRRGTRTGAVLLAIAGEHSAWQQAESADSSALRIGDSVWSLGNPFGALTLDGRAVRSQGVVSGLYSIAVDAPPARGRDGSILSDYRGPVIETDAAVNDGNQGGALLDAAGRLVGLCSLGVARERRVGTAVPLHLILEDLGLPPAQQAPAGQPAPLVAALQTSAERIARGLVLVYLIRPQGPGNPQGSPRPPPLSAATPAYRKRQLQQQWEKYYYEQQVFYIDQAVTALVIDAEAGLLLTAASNLHGDATEGYVLAEGGGESNQRCRVVGRDPVLDLALLRTEGPLARTQLELAERPHLACGDAVAIVGRHRDGGPYTFTTGLVAATDRYVEQFPHPFFQTDALGNYGNLGGAVIDAAGAVVGLVVRLHPLADWKLNSGVTLFVDSATIRELLPRLREGREPDKNRRIGLGVGTGDGKEGVRVKQVQPGSGAADGGVKPGDVILAIDGRDIVDGEDLKRRLVKRRIGDIAVLRIRRGEESIELRIELRAIE